MIKRLFVSAILAVAALATAHPSSARADVDWRDGDLVFHRSQGGQSTAIEIASGSRYTHVGIVRLTPRGPVVMEAWRTVREVPLADFLRRGEGGRYAVYRKAGLSRDDARKVLDAARAQLGRPYDIFFRPDPESVYCSELVWRAFAEAGLEAGQVERFGDLAIDNPSVRLLFSARWADHPDCKRAGSADACWEIVRDQEMVTPVSLTRTAGVERVFSSMK